MKYLKYSLIILALAIVADFAMISASSDYPVVPSFILHPNLKKIMDNLQVIERKQNCPR